VHAAVDVQNLPGHAVALEQVAERGPEVIEAAAGRKRRPAADDFEYPAPAPRRQKRAGRDGIDAHPRGEEKRAFAREVAKQAFAGPVGLEIDVELIDVRVEQVDDNAAAGRFREIRCKRKRRESIDNEHLPQGGRIPLPEISFFEK